MHAASNSWHGVLPYNTEHYCKTMGAKINRMPLLAPGDYQSPGLLCNSPLPTHPELGCVGNVGYRQRRFLSWHASSALPNHARHLSYGVARKQRGSDSFVASFSCIWKNWAKAQVNTLTTLYDFQLTCQLPKQTAQLDPKP